MRAAFLHGWAAAQTAASAAGGVSRGPRHWLNGLMLRLLYGRMYSQQSESF